MEPKLAIFDMDETLVSSDFIWAECASLFLKERKIEDRTDYVAMYYSEGLTKVINTLREKHSLKESEKDMFRIFSELSLPGYREEAYLKPYAAEALASFKNKGYLTCILSANSAEILSVVRNRFTSLVSDAWFSCKTIGSSKDEGKTYDTVCGFFGLEPKDAVLIDDADYACQGAYRMGLGVIQVGSDASLFKSVKSLEELL